MTDGPPARRPRYPGEGEPGRRIFVAAPLPADAVEAIAALVDRVRSRGVPGGGRDVRWVRLDGLHLTLRFLGPTLEPRIEPAREAVRTAGRQRAAASTSPSGPPAPFRKHGRPRTLWVDVLDGAPELAALATRLDGALVVARLAARDRGRSRPT